VIKLYIQYICVIQRETDGYARIAFPSKGHKLKVYRNEIETDGISGDEMVLEIRDASKAPQFPGPKPAAERIGDRVLKISDVTKQTSRLRDNRDLLKKPLGLFKARAQSVLAVPGGRFVQQAPATNSPYKDATWSFDTSTGVHSQQLTDTVLWEVDFVADCTYTLVVDGLPKARLVDGETLTFANLEEAAKKEFEKKGAVVEMKDVVWMYDLVNPEPKRKPHATAQALAPTVGRVAPWFDPARPGMLSGGDLPLCPVGEP
jgi:hypothetical protein